MLNFKWKCQTELVDILLLKYVAFNFPWKDLEISDNPVAINTSSPQIIVSKYYFLIKATRAL